MLLALFRDESGQGLVEYAIIVALLATGALATLHILGQKLSNIGVSLDPFARASAPPPLSIQDACSGSSSDVHSFCYRVHP
ncbi:MAG TPA: hypothetical protein VGD50_07060 [Candidatus Baltobacteraceae bacterium]